MAQEAIRRLLIAEIRVLYQASPCGASGGQSGTERLFTPITTVSRCKIYSRSAKYVLTRL